MTAEAASKATARRRPRGKLGATAATPAPKRLTQLELGEVSCVDVPANQGARHLLFKNLAHLDKSDAPGGGQDPAPGGEDPPQDGQGQGAGEDAGGDPPADPNANPSPNPAPGSAAKAAGEETEAALLARIADLQNRLAARDQELAWMADRMASMAAQMEAAGDTAKRGQVEQNMADKTPPAGTPDGNTQDVGKAQADAIAKAVEAAVAKATEDLSKRAEAAEKRAEAAEKAAQAEKAARELVDLTKAAEGPDFCNLPGEPLAKARALGALAGLPEAERATLEQALKAGNAAMGRNFREVGKSGDYQASTLPGATAAEAEMDRLAKAKASEKGISVAKAYSQVIAENPDLYARHKAEQAQRARSVA